jgi:small subunit ribosomal protein S1
MDLTANEDGAPSMESMTAQDMNAYLGDYEAPKRGDIRTGVIIEQNESGLVVDVGLKQEGLVPASDLDRLEKSIQDGVAPGDEVKVMVVRTSGREGHPILSISQARMQQDWINAEEMMKRGDLLEAEVISSNRGGLVVPFGKLRGFIPASHVSGMPRRLSPQQRRERLEAMVGQKIGAKIIEVDRQRRRLILSQRRALRAWQEKQRERVIEELTEGETRTGQVTSLTDFGAFVDLGGADGLIHVSELSWVRVDHPRDVLKIGDEVEVYVLNIDRKRKRIGLSLKRLQPDPWSLVDEQYHAGDLTEGRVTRVLDFGAFIELGLGIEGLLHPSEMIGTPELAPEDILAPGDTVLVKILHTDARRKRIALSTLRVGRDEWERWEAERQAARETEELEEAAEAQPLAEAGPGEGEQDEEPLPAEEESTPEAADEATLAPAEEETDDSGAADVDAAATEAEPVEETAPPESELAPTPEDEPKQAAQAETEGEAAAQAETEGEAAAQAKGAPGPEGAPVEESAPREAAGESQPAAEPADEGEEAAESR